jgi:hypothetical protein
MNRYSVFTHSYLSPVAVKHGFNWPSFFFGPLWALWIGCWSAVALYMIAMVGVLEFFSPWMRYALEWDPSLLISAVLAYFLLVLALAAGMSTSMNAWHRKSLLRRRYVEADVVTALDRGHALSLSSLVRPTFDLAVSASSNH